YEKHARKLNSLETAYESSMHGRIFWDERMVGIIGARGVGKTTLVLQHIKNNFGLSSVCLYVSLDDISFPYNTLVDLADDFSKNGGEILFLDEIHKYDNWSVELKNIYDDYPDLKVVFTGSSILKIMKGKADLSRRAVIHRMQGISFREFMQIRTQSVFPVFTLQDILYNHSQICQEVNPKVKPVKLFNEYLNHGFYPYFLQGIETYHIKLSGTITLSLENDLAQIHNIPPHYISKLKKLLKLLSEGVPFKPNVTRLAAAIGTSWQSVIRYLQYLDDAEIIQLIYPQGKTIGSLTKPEMVYLDNPNIFYVFHPTLANKGSLRAAFFINQMFYNHTLEIPTRGDFIADGKYTFEIGGKNKTYHQISGLENSFLAADDIEFGFQNKIPLWLFGFLY
ncbi:MAG: ATP-binding protein, partial [Bacteroidales bacterium]